MRSYIPLSTKLAATLALYLKIPHEQAKQMTTQQILRSVEWDHYPIRKADGGPDAAWNLMPRLKQEHRDKTAKIDVPAIAKSKRIDDRWRAFMRAVARGRKPPRAKSRWRRR